MIACLVLPTRDGHHNDLVIAEVSDMAMALRPPDIRTHDICMIEFVRVGPEVRPDAALAWAGYGRVEPWRYLEGGSDRMARVERMAVN